MSYPRCSYSRSPLFEHQCPHHHLRPLHLSAAPLTHPQGPNFCTQDLDPLLLQFITYGALHAAPLAHTPTAHPPAQSSTSPVYSLHRSCSRFGSKWSRSLHCTPCSLATLALACAPAMLCHPLQHPCSPLGGKSWTTTPPPRPS